MEAGWPRERIVGELVALFEESATRTQLAKSETLLAHLPAELHTPDAPSFASGVRALEAVLREAIRRHAEGHSKQAEHVRAANELLGWTTRTATDIRQILMRSNDFSSKTLSEVEYIDLTSMGVRYLLAGVQFTKPITTQKSVRKHLPDIAGYLGDAIENVVADPIAVRTLAASLRGEGTAPTANSEPSHHLLRPRRLLHVAAIGLVVLVSIAGAAYFLWPRSSPTSAPDQEPAPPVRQATVSYTEGKGLSTFLGPANTYPRGNPGNLPEGTVISVVCQERNGQVVHDPTGDPDRHTEPWPVWNKLSSGLWVSDLYTELPKVPGNDPPEGIPAC